MDIISSIARSTLSYKTNIKILEINSEKSYSLVDNI